MMCEIFDVHKNCSFSRNMIKNVVPVREQKSKIEIEIEIEIGRSFIDKKGDGGSLNFDFYFDFDLYLLSNQGALFRFAKKSKSKSKSRLRMLSKLATPTYGTTIICTSGGMKDVDGIGRGDTGEVSTQEGAQTWQTTLLEFWSVRS